MERTRFARIRSRRDETLAVIGSIVAEAAAPDPQP